MRADLRRLEADEPGEAQGVICSSAELPTLSILNSMLRSIMQRGALRMRLDNTESQPFFLKICNRLSHGGMFDGRDDDGGQRRIRMRLETTVQKPDQGRIIGFGSARGEGQFVRICSKDRSRFFTGIIPGFASESAQRVATFRVPASQKVRPHGFKNAWIQGSGGVGVEVDQLSRHSVKVGESDGTNDFTGNGTTNLLSGLAESLDYEVFQAVNRLPRAQNLDSRRIRGCRHSI